MNSTNTVAASTKITSGACSILWSRTAVDDDARQVADRRAGIGHLRGRLPGAMRSEICSRTRSSSAASMRTSVRKRHHRDQRVAERPSHPHLHHLSPLKRNLQGASQLPFRRRAANATQMCKHTNSHCVYPRAIVPRMRRVPFRHHRLPTKIALAVTNVLLREDPCDAARPRPRSLLARPRFP